MRLDTQIRKLARSSYWQEIYNQCQKCSGLQLFKNNYYFSGPQYFMLYWLRVYSVLYTELAQKDWEQLDEEVIKDDDRCDAFLYWRGKQLEKKLKESKMAPKKSKAFKVWKGKKDEKS